MNRTIGLLEGVLRFSAYEWLFEVRPFSRLTRTGRAEFYVAAWVLMLVAINAVAPLARGVAVVGAAVATYRLLDLVAMHAITLLKRSRQRLASVQRSLLLAVLNVGELALIISIYTQAASGRALLESLLYGFDVVTLRGPTSQPGWLLDLISVVGTSAALLLLTAVVSVVLGLISQSYVETGN